MNVALKTITLCIFLVMSSFLNSHSQSNETDSLKNVVSKSRNDSVRFAALIELFNLNIRINLDEAGSFLNAAEKIAEVQSNPYYEGTVLYNKSALYSLKGRRDTAYVLAEKAYNIFKGTSYRKGLALAISNLATSLGSQNEKIISLMREAHDIYLELGDTAGILFANRSFCHNFTYLNQFDSALFYIGKSLEINNIRKKDSEFAIIYKNYCNIYFEKNDFDDAVKYGILALQYTSKAKDVLNESWLNITLAGIYYKQKEFVKSREYYEKALASSLAGGFKSYVIRIYIEKSNLFLAIDEIDSAFAFAEKALELSKAINNKYWQMAASNAYYELYLKSKNYRKALEFALTSKTLCKEVNSNDDQSYLNIAVGYAYYYLDDYDSAESYAREAYDLATEMNDRKNIGDAAELLSMIAEKEGNYSLALTYFKEHKLIEDSIFNAGKTKVISEIETKYETGKKQQQIVQLESDKKLSNTELKLRNEALLHEQLLNKQKSQQLEISSRDNEIKSLEVQQKNLAIENQKKENEKSAQQLALSKKESELKDILIKAESLKQKYAIAGIVGLVFFGGYIFYLYQKRKKLNNQLSSSLTKLKQTQTQLIQLEKEKEAEAIRLRISRDIHDDIGSNLTKIAMLGNLASIQSKDKMPEMKEQLDRISDYARNVNSSMSEIIWAVNPKQDTLENLLAYMRVHTEEFLKDTGISYNIHFPPTIPNILLNPDLKRSLFLVLKESLNNSVKHAVAKNITVSFSLKGNNFEFIISDDGVGYNTTDTKISKGGNGINNLKSRMQQSGCNIKIQSSPGNGCIVAASGLL